METAIDHAPVNDVCLDDLIRQARKRDRTAFETLYRMHHRQVHALALRLTRDTGRAEELTQEAFVRAWQALPGFRGESRLGTWLHTITVRAHAARRRSENRRDRRELPEEAVGTHAFAARRAMPDTDIDLERAIARLPDGARDVLVLHDVHGYKHREVADMLGVAEGTSKAQLHRARRMIRAFLAD